MARLARLAANLLALPLLATPGASRGRVWVVDEAGGPGSDFLQIRDAVAAAGEGDVLLVRSGYYAEFRIDGKSLTVAADEGADVLVAEYFGLVVPCVVRNLAAGQRVVFRGIEFSICVFTPVALPGVVVVANDQGDVWFEDCGFQTQELCPNALGRPPVGGIVVSRSTSVLLLDCAVRSGQRTSQTEAHGVACTDSTIGMFGCSAVGGSGGSCAPGGPSGDGVHVEGGTLFASRCTFEGGSGIQCIFFPGPANGGHGLHVGKGARVLSRELRLVAGRPGTTATGEPGLPGRELHGAVDALWTLDGAGRSTRASSPVRAGENLVLTWNGRAGERALTWVSSTTRHELAPALGGLFAVGAPPVDVLLSGPLPPDGSLSSAFPVPPLPAGAEAGTFFVQSLFLGPAGSHRVGAPSTFLLLDSTF